MSGWIKDDPECGKEVLFQTDRGEEHRGILVAVHAKRDIVIVRDRESGELLAGNQWEEA